MSNDLICVGNAIVDIVSKINDKTLDKFALKKGTMKIVTNQEFNSIFNNLKEYSIISGGSAANTAVGFSSLGGKAYFIGQLGNDNFGSVFQKDIMSEGVILKSHSALKDHQTTSKSMVLVSKDAERTMCTYLGASTKLSYNLIDNSIFEKKNIIYIEGYLFDKIETKNTIKKICEIAKINKMKISLSLSDVFCVERHRKDFLDLIKNYIDILFANQDELISLYSSNFKESLKNIRRSVKIGAITSGKQGSIVFNKKEIFNIEAKKTKTIVDTTGAGDIYASGFLFGISKNLTLKECGELGANCASKIISHFGARSQVKLKTLL